MHEASASCCNEQLSIVEQLSTTMAQILCCVALCKYGKHMVVAKFGLKHDTMTFELL